MRRPADVPVEANVPCGGAIHRIGWDGRHLALLDHPGDRESEDIVIALSGEPAFCRDIEEAWARIDPDLAMRFLYASDDDIEAVARRLALTVDQRARFLARDDTPPAERARLGAGFDQRIYAATIASLGPALARSRAVLARRAGPVWAGWSRARNARRDVRREAQRGRRRLVPAR